MSLPNPTSLVTAQVNISISDLLQSGTTILNRVNTPFVAKTITVQYDGYITFGAVPININPFAPVVSWTVFYVRFVGPSGVLGVQLQATGGALQQDFNLDVGAMFLYVNPVLSQTVLGGISPGIVGVTLSTSVSGTSAELLAAG